MSITQETRAAGLCESRRKLTPRQTMIIGALRRRAMTAAEVADRLGFSDLNAVKPRLHELMEAGVVRTIGSRPSTRSGVVNAIYELTEKAALRGANTESGGMGNYTEDSMARKEAVVNGQISG